MSEERKADGTFNFGNSAWRARSKHGVDKIFKTPADLWDACLEYFIWAEENPLYVPDTLKYMGEGSLMAIPKLRLLTIEGMCIFMGTPKSTWYTYREYPDYRETCLQAESMIYQQKLNGAAADQFNAGIIQRHLGLTDKQDINQSGSVSNQWTVTIVRPEEKHEPQGSQAGTEDNEAG